MLYPVVFISITIGIITSAVDWLTLGGIIAPPLDLKWIMLNYILMHNSWFVHSDLLAYGSGTWLVLFIMGVAKVNIPILWNSSGIASVFWGGGY